MPERADHLDYKKLFLARESAFVEADAEILLQNQAIRVRDEKINRLVDEITNLRVKVTKLELERSVRQEKEASSPQRNAEDYLPS